MPNAKQYLNYEEAKKVVKELGITTYFLYIKAKHYKKHEGLPCAPHLEYKGKGWVDWVDFLGSKFKTYEEAKRTVLELGITTYTSYFTLKGYKKCKGLPANPFLVYKDKGWVSWADFLGNVPKFKTFEEARAIARTLGLKTSGEWNKIDPEYRKELKIPLDPKSYYYDSGWIGWADFLGRSDLSKHPSYEEIKKIIHPLNIKSSVDYQRNLKKYREGRSLPSHPRNYYLNKGWVSWEDFLGKDKKT
jgi:hypothetical protein